MTLYMIHAPLDLRALNLWAVQRGLIGRGAFDEGAVLHRLLSALFGKGVVQPFRLFTPERARHASFYAYAPEDETALAETARSVGAPDELAVLSPDALQSKPMPAAFPAGRRLGFDIRIRPVRRTCRTLADPRNTTRPTVAAGAELDAFRLEALTRFPDGGLPDGTGMIAAGRSREAVYADWLAERLRPGARLVDAHLTAFRRSRAMRTGRPIEGPDATIHGTLEVTDPAAFGRLLAGGVGRHRAYGYGMLVLRPPGRAPLTR